jgi:hypothetical protein
MVSLNVEIVVEMMSRVFGVLWIVQLASGGGLAVTSMTPSTMKLGIQYRFADIVGKGVKYE